MDPLTIPTLDCDLHLERSEIIDAAYASDMSSEQFEDLVAALYPEETLQ